MKKYTFINSAVFKGANAIPLYRVFDTETKELTWSAFAYNKDKRGQLSVGLEYNSASKRDVTDWRNLEG